ncbi:MAG: sigma 54-interacting transcriptional regulator [Candidatus Cloacimonetes bacterium]|nr:sigma 54-interacting transcriptional regulator [Candidatus Cloacimonadota bacterium]
MTVEFGFLENKIEYFKTIFDTIQAGINVIDKNGIIVYVNSAYCLMNGYKREELIGNSLSIILPDSNPLKGMENYRNIINRKTNTPFLKESYNTHQNGKKFPVLISWNYLINKDSLEGMVTVVHDLTELKKTKRELRQTKQHVIRLENILQKREYLEYMMGTSEEIKNVHKLIEQVAKTDLTVLITGETGTGKEIVAEAIHNFSNRANKDLIKIDCGAIPESLIESELFGHVRGAFTGAIQTRNGAFKKADKGTIFLDEISNLSWEMQKKLLRVIQEREIVKIGSSQPEKLDIRIIAASNEDLIKLVDEFKFRSDLFYRLYEFQITLPPLRSRKSDIPILSQRFLKEACHQLKTPQKNFNDQSISSLLGYHWSGNVRELKNVIRRAAIVSGKVISSEDLHFVESVNNETSFNKLMMNLENYSTFDLKKYIKQQNSEIEEAIILKTLEKFKGNKSKTARFLNLDYKTLFYKVKKISS